MEKYYNATTQEWYYEGQTMTRELDNGVFSGIPTVEQLTAWGFVEWIEPVPTPEQLLERAKANKIAELEVYDVSDAVNSFTINGNPMWLTRDERTQIDESVSAYSAKGETQMTKYFAGVPYTFPLTAWKSMLNDLIVYASEALNVTESHKAAISQLDTVQEVEDYDYTQGYPEKLEF